MGAYGSQPVREKVSIDETVGSISYGASSMQGWRLHQEDAHSCCPNFAKETALFAVYDGHGGHEVAQYAAMKYPDFLKDLAAAEKKSLADALEQSFLAFDKMLTQKDVVDELLVISGTQVEEGEEPEEDEAAALYEEATMPLEQVLERYKGPLSSLRKAGGQDHLSPVIQTKQDRPSLLGGADSSSESKASNEAGSDDCQMKLSFGKLINGHSDNENNENIEREIRVRQQQQSTNTENGAETQGDTSSAEGSSDPQPEVSSSNSAGPSGSSSSSQDPEPGSSAVGQSSQGGLQLLMGEDIEDSEESDDDENSDDSDSEEEAKWKAKTKAENKGEYVEEEEDDDDEDEEEDDGVYNSDEDMDEVPMDGLKQIEQPGVDSGTTAVVAVLIGKQLHVANAGDSRCVISRSGKALDMSIDHKPEDESEFSRISKAGGHVTEDGRVNGGLNLSRALGDHRYKQNTTLPAEEQMVTALPDVKTLTIEDGDEFMVLACDGIWNVMTSQEVVTFVMEKLKNGTAVLSQICEEMFEFCLAPNTEGDGSGCDNMTCIIVLFKPVSSFSQQGSLTEDGKRRASSEPDGVTFGEMSKKLRTQEEDSSNNSSSS